MKALSIRQPFASAILAGFKPIEYRTWLTAHRGALLIHAGKQLHQEGSEDLELMGRLADAGFTLHRGCLLGVVNLAKCEWVDAGDGESREAWWHIAEPRVAFAKPPAWSGKVGLFDVPDELLAAQLQAEQLRELAAIYKPFADGNFGRAHEAGQVL
jgi:ASCH domain